MIKVVKYCAAIAVLILFVTNLNGCALPEASKSDVTHVIKSDNDQRNYKYLELPNKLRVLLISDVNTDKAAASLDVFVGSRQDPDDFQGLAHFLEHMLFLGTEKYPEAGEYQAFINNHNGSHNAYTSFEHTNYFFDIDPTHLNVALDRFSQFFIAPLFTARYVEREKNAVHSEYMAKIKTDQRKALDVFKSVMNPKHPFAKFSVGNLDTLSNEGKGQRNLRNQLVNFYTDYYSANVMTLVVLGNQSLAELETIVSSKFAPIPNNDKQIKTIKEPLFNTGTLPLNITIKPEKAMRVLSIAFPTEEELPYFRQKPLHYLGNIIGHEGQGSLLSYLKAEGWVESLGAGSGLSYKGGGNFSINIELTEKGLSHTDQIITAVFQIINRIKDSGTTRWLFDEQRALAEQQFRYLERSSPINYVSSLASNLQYYPAPLVLSGSYVMSDFDSTLIHRFLNYLNPDNALVTLSAPAVAVDTVSHFYGAQYQVKPVSDKTLKRWKNAGLNPEITLPKANEFIADNLSLKTQEKIQSIPALISEKDGLRLWFKQDDHFQIPKSSVFLSVRTPMANDSAQRSVLLAMFVRMINDELNEYSYPAILAGLGYSIKEHTRGFTIKINGFNDKQFLLLDKITDALTSPKFDSVRFKNIRQRQIRQLENVDKSQPYKLLIRQLPELLYRNKWSDDQLLSAYETVSTTDLQTFATELLSKVDIDMLVYGNFVEKEAIELGDKVHNALLKKSVSVPAINIVKLDKGERSYQMSSDYSDSSLLFYLQAPDINKSSRAAMGVTAHWLRSDFYTKLRTEKQLGYVVAAGAYPVIDVPGMMFLVQSPVVGPTQLQKEIKLFIQQKLTEIKTLPESVFENHKQTLIQRLSESPKNVLQQSERYWQDIAQGYLQFDSRDQLIQAMKNLTFNEWRQFFHQQVAGSERLGLWVFSVGQFSDQVLVNTLKVDNVPRFKSERTYYQFP